VEVVAEGAEERVKKLVLWCHKGPPSATVLAVHETLDNWKGEFTSFEIVF
jgi:acylphosphatase